MAPLDAELRRTFHVRLRALESHVVEIIGRLEPSKHGFRGALGLVAEYPALARASLEDGLRKSADDSERVDNCKDHLLHLQTVADLVENWFSGGTDSSAIPIALTRAVEAELTSLRRPRQAVLTTGRPGNFETYIADLEDKLFKHLASAPRGRGKFAMIQVPRLEGGQALSHPLVVGHEVAHLALSDKEVVRSISIKDKLDTPRGRKAAKDVPQRLIEYFDPVPKVLLHGIAQRWLEETMCDAYSLKRFGPAAVSALGSYLETVGAMDRAGSHPPGRLRIELMLTWLGPLGSPRLQKLIEPWSELRRFKGPDPDLWVRVISDALRDLTQQIPASLEGLGSNYEVGPRERRVDAGIEMLDRGFPPNEVRIRGGAATLNTSDILNAGWAAERSQPDDSPIPIDKLVMKSIETDQFQRLWQRAARDVDSSVGPGDSQRAERKEVTATQSLLPNGDGSFGSVVPAQEVERRLRSGSILISPVPHKLKGVGVDVRLSNKFIVFEPSGTPSFDPLDTDLNPRAIQGYAEKDWGDVFVLHPNELVLASTFEYIGLPADIAGLVVTRSSYGRLGLVTATAVLVHPHYQGCLTLELLNLGEVPLVLTPGERVAQLFFNRVHPPAPEPSEEDKYRCPTGPEFSKVQDDRDALVLTRMRGRHTGAVELGPLGE